MNRTEEPLNQRYSANRWNTKVSLECWQSGSIRRILWFSDFQDAYIWVREHTEQNREINWILRSFTAVARDLDERWSRGDNGATIAIGGGRRFRTQYEPEATEAATARDARRPSASEATETSASTPSEASAESNSTEEEMTRSRNRFTEEIIAELNRNGEQVLRSRD